MKQFYKLMGIIALLLGTNLLSNDIDLKEKKDFMGYYVTRHDSIFSTVFEMATDQYPVGSVEKNCFHIADHYNSYDRFGLYEGQGICSLFFPSIDVYNVEALKIGRIEGENWPTENAKFSFYDIYEQCVAIGYLEADGQGYSLIDPDYSDRLLAQLKRNFIPDRGETWEVILYYPEQISPKLVKIFVAFIFDRQGNKTIT